MTLDFRDRRGTLAVSLCHNRINRNHAATTIFFSVNRSPTRYDFGGGAKAICYNVKLTLTFTQFPDNSQFQAVLSIDKFEMNESEMMHSDSNTCMFVF